MNIASVATILICFLFIIYIIKFIYFLFLLLLLSCLKKDIFRWVILTGLQFFKNKLDLRSNHKFYVYCKLSAVLLL